MKYFKRLEPKKSELIETDEKFETSTFLQEKPKTDWILAFDEILISEIWENLILTTILLNYFIACFVYVFMKNHIGKEIYYIILAFDVIYILDYIAAVKLFFWKNTQISLNKDLRSKIDLIVDLFLAFPYSYIYEATAHESYNFTVFLSLRAILVLRLYHVVLYFKEKVNVVNINHVVYFIAEYVIYMAVLVHATACLWYLIAFPDDPPPPSGAWTKVEDIRERYKDPASLYVHGLYFALTYITGRNFGDIVPLGIGEKFFLIVIVCVGFIFTTAIFIAAFSFLFERTHKLRSALRIQMQDIKKYLSSSSMNEKDKKLIHKYYEILWTKKRGVREPNQLFQLPFPLKSEICVDVNIRALQTSLLFRNKPEAFLRSVAYLMRHKFYQPGESIYHVNVIKVKMIFVVLGAIEVLSEEDDESSVITFGAGTCLGESALVLSLPSKCSVRAACYTELQVLDRKDFYTIIDLFPELYASIRETIMKRIAEIEPIESTRLSVAINLYSFFRQQQKTSTIKMLKDKLRGLAPKTEKKDKYLSLYQLKDNKDDEEKFPVFVSASFPWILQPDSSFFKCWEILILAVAVVICVLYPRYIIFRKKYPEWFLSFAEIVDLFLMMDVVVVLCTAIQQKNKIIKTFMEILHERLTQFGFYLDFFSCIKLELFFEIFTRNERFGEVLRLNRLLKIYRIPKKFHELENQIDRKIIKIRMAKYISYILISEYLLGAVLYMTTCFTFICTEDGWFFTKLMYDLKTHVHSSYTSNEIVTSQYYALFFLSGMTFPNILPNNITDKVTACLATLFGIILLSYCIAEFSAALTRQLQPVISFQESLFSVKTFMQRKNMSKELTARVENFFTLQWNYDKGLGLKGQSLFFNASRNIQMKTQFNDKLETIANLPLFQGKDLNFLKHLSTVATALILPPNEFITYKGEMIKILYIIQEGYCVRKTERSVILGPKSFFGSLLLFSSLNSPWTIETLTHVKILCIAHKTLWKSASMFPVVAKEFQRVINEINLEDEVQKILMFQNPDSKKNTYDLQGSIINMIAYCKRQKESYSEPFKQLGYLYWIQFFLLPICILPYGFFLKLWMSLRLAVVLINLLIEPYNLIEAPHTPLLHDLHLALSIVAYVDLYVMLFVGYYGPKNQLVMHPLKTAIHYLKGKFIFDFVFCFPWKMIAIYLYNLVQQRPPSGELTPTLEICFLMLKLCQLYRLEEFFNYLSEDIRRKRYVIQIVKFIFLVIVLINVFASINVKISCKYYIQEDLPKAYIHNDSYVQIPGRAHHPLHRFTMICLENSWIDKSKFQYYTELYQVYILSVYFVTSTFTACGISGITPEYSANLLLTIFIILNGMLLIGYIYVNILSYKADWNSLLSKNQEMINEIKKFMGQEKVRKNLQEQVIDRIEYKWKRTRGAEPNEILANLHAALHEDATLPMYESVLRDTPIFGNVDSSFFRIIVKIVKIKYYLRKEYVFKADDVVSNVYIIYSGTVKITSKSGNSEEVMGIGGVFGNITPHLRHKISVTIAALSNVEVLCMEAHDFHDILQKYPSMKETITNNSGQDVDYIMPKFTQAYNIEPAAVDSRDQKFIKNIIECLLICLPWKLFRVAISPYSLIYTFFDSLCLILAYPNCILVIYEFCFQHHTLALLYVAIITDVIFLMKLILDMHKSYEDHYGELVVSNKKIIKRYFQNHTSRRCLDFLCNLPLFYLAFLLSVFSELNYYLVFSSLRMITLFRFLTIFDYYNEKSNQLLTNKICLKTGYTIVWCTLIIHIFSCGWYLCACPLVFCFEESWTSEILEANESKPTIYITCLYFMIGLFTTSGNNDVTPSNLHEKIYLIMVMVVAIFLVGIFIGEVMNILNSLTLARAHYEHEIKELQIYLQNCNVHEFQMKKMRNYVQKLWAVSNGKQIPRLDLLLHSVTMQDLMLEIYGHHLKNSHIFSEVEESFTRQLVGYLRRTIFFPENYIVKHGDSDKSMYFIHYGNVEILTVHPNLTETVHEVLSAGNLFGVIQGLFHGIPHHFSFRAKTTVHTLSLCLSDWEYLLHFFPESKESIYMKANNIYT